MPHRSLPFFLLSLCLCTPVQAGKTSDSVAAGEQLRKELPLLQTNGLQETDEHGTYMADSLVISPDVSGSPAQETIYYGLTLCLLATTGGIWLYLRKRKRYRKSLLALQQEKDNLSQILNEKKETAAQEQQQLFTAALQNSAVYHELLQLLKQHKRLLNNEELISPSLWEQLEQHIDLYGNHFTRRLRQEHPLLKEQDIRFCCLLKAGFKYSDIACLLGRTTNMMYKRRDSIIARMGKTLSPSEFEAFIRTF